jgi:hypothetical protein
MRSEHRQHHVLFELHLDSRAAELPASGLVRRLGLYVRVGEEFQIDDFAWQQAKFSGQADRQRLA